jgi:hypothetical protein
MTSMQILSQSAAGLAAALFLATLVVELLAH